MGAFTAAAYVEEFARAAKVAIPIVLVVLLADGWACREAQHFGGGVEGLGNHLLDCSMGLTGQLSEIWSMEWQ